MAEVSKVEQEPVQILQVMVNSVQEVTLRLEVVETEETVIVSYISQATHKELLICRNATLTKWQWQILSKKY